MTINQNLYSMIFKRKSFHLFRNIGNAIISQQEIKAIEEAYKTFTPLYQDIKTAIKIVPADQTTCHRGQQYCILLYSEKKGNYLQNIGYLGEQLDLFLVFQDIGGLWYGIGKTSEVSFDGLDFVIMIAISKIGDKTKFRKDMFKSKRKAIDEIWIGQPITGITDIIRFAPSACNTQPWIVEHEGNTLKVYRYQKPGKRGIMPKDKVTYYNRIDIGIFLCFLELCLEHNGIEFECRHFVDDSTDKEKTIVQEYDLLL